MRSIINDSVKAVSVAYPEGEAKEMVFALLEHLAGTKRHTHIVEPSYSLDDETAAAVEAAVARLASGEPLQYVIGKACFYGRDFNVSPSVLIPRPETEILCRTAIDAFLCDGGIKGTQVPSRERCTSIEAGLTDSQSPKVASRILDLCTGSGCIAWTMALEKPGSEVFAVDISDAALAVATSQDFADELSKTGAMAPKFFKADVLADIPADLSEVLCTDSSGILPEGDSSARCFDIILSNPPYVMDKEKALMRTNVLDHEPHLALFVSDDDPLIFYRAVARWAASLLSDKGFGLVEINEALGEETAQVYLDAGFGYARVLQDFSGRDRFVLFRRK